MKTAFHEVAASMTNLIERHPAFGYIGGTVPTATGFWVLLQRATSIVAFISVLVGLAVGVLTFLVQRKQLKKLDQKTTD